MGALCWPSPGEKRKPTHLSPQRPWASRGAATATARMWCWPRPAAGPPPAWRRRRSTCGRCRRASRTRGACGAGAAHGAGALMAACTASAAWRGGGGSGAGCRAARTTLGKFLRPADLRAAPHPAAFASAFGRRSAGAHPQQRAYPGGLSA